MLYNYHSSSGHLCLLLPPLKWPSLFTTYTWDINQPLHVYSLVIHFIEFNFCCDILNEKRSFVQNISTVEIQDKL